MNADQIVDVHKRLAILDYQYQRISEAEVDAKVKYTSMLDSVLDGTKDFDYGELAQQQCFANQLEQVKTETLKLKEKLEEMLTMNWEDLQYKKPKHINKKVKQKKDSQVVKVQYPLSKSDFSASSWKDYKEFMKEQQLKEELQKKTTERSKPSKGKLTKTKEKKSLTRKEQYQEDLKHPLWAKKREVILFRDNYQCRVCGSKTNLQVHHLKYSNGKRAWEYPNLDLITLCEDCHKKVHSNCKHQLYPKYEDEALKYNFKKRAVMSEDLEANIDSTGFVGGDDSKTVITLKSDGIDWFRYKVNVKNGEVRFEITGDWELGFFKDTCKWIAEKIESLDDKKVP